jgi:hypothetical protein
MEAGLIGDTPGAQSLVRVCAGRGDCAEEIHAPLGATSLHHIEESQRNLHTGDPCLFCSVQDGCGREAVGGRIGHEKVIEWSARGAHFGGIVDHRLVSDIVGTHLKLEVRLRVVRAMIDEGLHHLVLPDVIVRALARVIVVIGLPERAEC